MLEAHRWFSLSSHQIPRNPGYSFSLGKKPSWEEVQAARREFVSRASDPANPLELPVVGVTIRMYGANDFGNGIGRVCPLLDRVWSKEVCENPFSAITQSLPESFELLDLKQLHSSPKPDVRNCLYPDHQKTAKFILAGDPPTLCETGQVSSSTRYYTAVIRIAGDLGAKWYVDDSEQETGYQQAGREGAAIASFALHGVSLQENYQPLIEAACRLRRPDSPSSRQGPACGDKSN
ncbi:MAG: hypothetical protein QM744_02820 [Mesorhizobium sp.]